VRETPANIGSVVPGRPGRIDVGGVLRWRSPDSTRESESASFMGVKAPALMNTDKRSLMIECATAVVAISLWHLTLWLLGQADTMPPGIKAKVGSVIVLIGCFVIARPVVAMTVLLFRSKAVPPVPPRPASGEPAVRSPRSALFRRSGARPETFPR
jgi:hypothetical protein